MHLPGEHTMGWGFRLSRSRLSADCPRDHVSKIVPSKGYDEVEARRLTGSEVYQSCLLPGCCYFGGHVALSHLHNHCHKAVPYRTITPSYGRVPRNFLVLIQQSCHEPKCRVGEWVAKNRPNVAVACPCGNWWDCEIPAYATDPYVILEKTQ